MTLQWSIGSFILIQNTNIRVSEGNDCWEFFSSGPSATIVQIRKTFLVASAVLLTVKDCSKLHLLKNCFCNTKQWSLHNISWQIIQVYRPWEFWEGISNEIKTMLVFRPRYLGFIFMWAWVVNVFFKWWPLQCGVLVPSAFSILRIKPLHKFHKTSGKLQKFSFNIYSENNRSVDF